MFAVGKQEEQALKLEKMRPNSELENTWRRRRSARRATGTGASRGPARSSAAGTPRRPG